MADGDKIEYVRICYVLNGQKKTAFAKVLNGSISWTPPKGVSSVYFRANDATKDGIILVNGQAVRLLPYSGLESDADWVEVHGKIEGTVSRSEAMHRMRSFNYEPLPADVKTFEFEEVEDVPFHFKRVREKLNEQAAKAAIAAVDQAETAKKKCKCPFWWHPLHLRKRGHKREVPHF